MNEDLNWSYFRNRAIVDSLDFEWMTLIMWNGIRTQFCQGRANRNFSMSKHSRNMKIVLFTAITIYSEVKSSLLLLSLDYSGTTLSILSSAISLPFSALCIQEILTFPPLNLPSNTTLSRERHCPRYSWPLRSLSFQNRLGRKSTGRALKNILTKMSLSTGNDLTGKGRKRVQGQRDRPLRNEDNQLIISRVKATRNYLSFATAGWDGLPADASQISFRVRWWNPEIPERQAWR